MSPADGTPLDRPDAGFSILEVLVALAIVSVSIVAIASVMSTNTRGVTALENHVAMIETAQTVFATEIPLRKDLAPGRKQGQLRSNYRWQVDVSPIGGEWAPAGDSKVAWTPELVKVHVRSPTGAQIDLSTVRLMPRAQQQ